jgi:multiple sugar transport system permease protein
MGLLDTYTVMIIMHMMFSIPTTVYICTNFIDDLPYEIEEAAFVDGATKQHTFFKIVLPLCSPALITSSTLSFLGSWNNFQLSLIFGQAKTKTLPVALYGFMSSDAVRWGRLLAAAMIIMVPAILLTMVLQKYIISGLSAGSIKG